MSVYAIGMKFMKGVPQPGQRLREAFSLRVDRVEDKAGLVLVHGRWLTGSALDAESVGIERTGKPLSVHAVRSA